MFSSDEVSALVLDIGTSTLRAGYAGDDTPKAIIPTCYGYTTVDGDVDVPMSEEGEGENAPPKPAKKINMFVGNSGPSVWRRNMEVAYPVKNSLIEDFAPIPALISHAFRDIMRCNPAEHPVLVTEPAWNTATNRERMAEILFEEFDVPAFYIANTGVLNALTLGDEVSQQEREWMALYCAKLVEANAQHILTNPGPNRPGIQLLPHQLIASKQTVDVGTPPRFTLRDDRATGTTDTWRTWYESREVEDWVQSVGGVLDQGWNEQAAVTRGARHYEFPTGYNYYFGPERFGIGEQFFTHSASLAAKNQNLPMPLPSLISQSLAACDQDLRQVLVGNVVLTGGGSLFSGLSDRLASELQRNFPHVKIHAPGNPTERRYGAWLGGSILGSLGTFHQLWISKEEWQEHGRAIVGQRCK
ncbi:hypothetical protein EUX98_g397 [Antrodiella citrinella]|uniref:Actin-related protein Arp4p n=1 Tax=Antrodiella citrinella TaxID=2447956 RepID=A0A4S4N5H0_9APHY|nr:hypothetical protein EUX98_g397 [Antrodiella citrinella]